MQVWLCHSRVPCTCFAIVNSTSLHHVPSSVILLVFKSFLMKSASLYISWCLFSLTLINFLLSCWITTFLWKRNQIKLYKYYLPKLLFSLSWLHYGDFCLLSKETSLPQLPIFYFPLNCYFVSSPPPAVIFIISFSDLLCYALSASFLPSFVSSV